MVQDPQLRQVILRVTNGDTSDFDIPDVLDVTHPSIDKVTLKRIRTMEKKSLIKSIDIVFVDGTMDDNNNNNNNGGSENRKNDKDIGVFRELQCIKPWTKSKFHFKETKKRNTQGYLLFAYKTMEDMSTVQFTSQWKTWTGARLLCHTLPDQVQIKRLCFLQKVSGGLDFEFIMLAQLPTLITHAPTVLNVLNYVRPRVNALVLSFREDKFRVNCTLGGRLSSPREQEEINTNCLRIHVSNHSARVESSEHGVLNWHLMQLDEEGNQTKRRKSVRNEETQTEEKEETTRVGETQTDERDIGGGERRRHSVCSIPRSVPVYDFVSIFDENEIPSIDNGLKPRDSLHQLPSSIVDSNRLHVSFVNTKEENLLNSLGAQLQKQLSVADRTSSFHVSADNLTIRPSNENPEEYFRKLRTKYFNSPEYYWDDRESVSSNERRNIKTI